MRASNELLELNSINAEAISEEQRPFDASAAELTMLNTAELAARLDYSFFPKLSGETLDVVVDTVSLAKEIINDPDVPADIPEIIDDKESYRINITRPLFAVQQKLASKDFDPNDEDEVAKLKTIINLAGAAFTLVYDDTKSLDEVKSSREFFWRNTLRANLKLERS